MTIERRLSPEEEEELRTKQAELDDILDRLAQNELELETLHAEINSLFSTYNAAVLPQQSLINEYFKGEYPANTLVEITALAEPEDRIGLR